MNFFDLTTMGPIVYSLLGRSTTTKSIAEPPQDLGPNKKLGSFGHSEPVSVNDQYSITVISSGCCQYYPKPDDFFYWILIEYLLVGLGVYLYIIYLYNICGAIRGLGSF